MMFHRAEMDNVPHRVDVNLMGYLRETIPPNVAERITSGLLSLGGELVLYWSCELGTHPMPILCPSYGSPERDLGSSEYPGCVCVRPVHQWVPH